MTDAERWPHVGADLQQLRDAVGALRADVLVEGGALLDEWQPAITRPSFLPAAHNLACYLALRRRDLRPLQQRLAVRGLSSLGRSEAHVLATLNALFALLVSATDPGASDALAFPSRVTFAAGKEAIAREAETLFGPGLNGRSTRIMVTVPSEAAESPAFAEAILQAGAECVRINCAHDSPAVWEAMIANLRRAEQTVGDGRRLRVLMDLAGPKVRTVRPAKEARERLFTGDRLLLVHDLGSADPTDLPRVACTIPDVVGQLALDAEIWFDDGQLGARVVELRDDGVLLAITHAPPKGKKLRSDKGLNLPGTDLAIVPLTAKDRADLAVVAQHADMVGYSFVQSADDVALLQDALADHVGDRKPPALVLKIETRRAVHQLPELIVRAAGRQPSAVMIARGDLAVELGYERLAEIQEEILWLCEAAHTPVIWATQVLESLSKEGLPSRAEVSDAALAVRAECVMLNKGPYVAEAVRLLDGVLLRMQNHQVKKTAHLRALRSWEALFTESAGTGREAG
jgi:pyruvate kinase